MPSTRSVLLFTIFHEPSSFSGLNSSETEFRQRRYSALIVLYNRGLLNFLCTLECKFLTDTLSNIAQSVRENMHGKM